MSNNLRGRAVGVRRDDAWSSMRLLPLELIVVSTNTHCNKTVSSIATKDTILNINRGSVLSQRDRETLSVN